MLKWSIKFLRKFYNRYIKITRGNSILIYKFINLRLFTIILYGVGARCDQGERTERRAHGGDERTHTCTRDVTGVIRTQNSLQTDFSRSCFFFNILTVICWKMVQYNSLVTYVNP